MQKHIHQLEVDRPVHLLVHSLLLRLEGQNVILRGRGASARPRRPPPTRPALRRLPRRTCSVYQKVSVRELVVSLTGKWPGMPVQNMIMLTRARKLCQCSTWSSRALGDGHTGRSRQPPHPGALLPRPSGPSPHREWFSPRATAMRQMPWEVSMSPFCTACRS